MAQVEGLWVCCTICQKPGTQHPTYQPACRVGRVEDQGSIEAGS